MFHEYHFRCAYYCFKYFSTAPSWRLCNMIAQHVISVALRKFIRQYYTCFTCMPYHRKCVTIVLVNIGYVTDHRGVVPSNTKLPKESRFVLRTERCCNNFTLNKVLSLVQFFEHGGRHLFYKDMKVAHRRYKGYVMQEKFGTMIEDIEKLDVYDDDVWVIGFPRSGTTWLQYVVWCIKNRLQLDKQDVISTFYRHIEYSTMFHQKEEDLPEFMRDSVGKVREAKRPRFIKSHLPWELLPKQIRTFERRPKIIHVVRDPRDVCTSNYHIYKLYNYYEGDYNFFCRFFISGKSIMGPYVDNVCSYYKHKHQPNILLLRYEDMKSNIEAVLWKIANFLEVPLCDQDVQNILPRLSFDAMKSNPLVNKADTLDLMKTIDMCGNEGFEYFRIGKSGTWSTEEMSEEVQEMFKRTVLKRFDDIGLHYT